MEPARYVIQGRSFTAADLGLQDALARVYNTAERPRCMCVPGGVEMYIARHRQYVVKRMPQTGHRHHPSCPAYEPEQGTSGLGELMGEAIIEHSPEQVEIRVDFPLARVPSRTVPRGEPAQPAEVQAPRRRMSLRAVLHLLWERAGFNRWYPAMAGKRSQGVLHKYLGEAAQGIMVKGGPLAERLYVPEPFRLEYKAEIAERRRRKLALLHSPEDAVQFKMAIVVGEFNGADATTLGRRLLIRHMADAPLYIDTKVWAKVERVYGALLQARDADLEHKPRVIVAALVYAKREHLYQVDTLSMMLTTDQWLPADGPHELALTERLCAQGRIFMKPLQYDARSAAAFPNVMLLDVGEAPKHLHVISGFADAKERAAKDKALLAEGDGAWIWHTEKEMPALPAAVRKPAYRRGDEGTAINAV